jgi:hypothetical protein
LDKGGDDFVASYGFPAHPLQMVTTQEIAGGMNEMAVGADQRGGNPGE